MSSRIRAEDHDFKSCFTHQLLQLANSGFVTLGEVELDAGVCIQIRIMLEYDVRAEAAGYADSTRTGIPVAAGANTPDVNFELVPSGD